MRRMARVLTTRECAGCAKIDGPRGSGESRRERFEGVLPFSVKESAGAPELAQRFDSSCALDLADIFGFPTEILQNGRNLGFGAVVVAADEHRWRPAREIRAEHECVAHARESLHEVRFGRC